jgi:hypothetical protein
VRRLQREYYSLRNINLNRVLACPYAGCPFKYPIDEPGLIQKHLHDVHTIIGCNFCDEPLFADWRNDQRLEHFLKKHKHVLDELSTSAQDRDVKSPDAGLNKRSDQFDKSEKDFNFCTRCGRDHTLLDAPWDRNHHDAVCYDKGLKGSAKWTACEDCGGRLSPDDTEPHQHRAVPDGENAPFCELCGLSLGVFSPGYQQKHLIFCRGHEHIEYRFCPWEGGALSNDQDKAKEHIDGCWMRPKGLKRKNQPSPDPTALPKKPKTTALPATPPTPRPARKPKPTGAKSTT